MTLFGIFADMENSKLRFDFRCDAKLSGKDFVRGKCFDKYEKQYNKFGIPVYGFVIANFSVVAIVSVIYSQCIQSTVHALEARDSSISKNSQRLTQTPSKSLKKPLLR